jgi:hypothetical protein
MTNLDGIRREKYTSGAVNLIEGFVGNWDEGGKIKKTNFLQTSEFLL